MKRAEGSSEAERAGEIRQYTAALKNRTTMLLEQGGMDLLARRCVAIAGCGGVGGATAITLARLGVGKFILADPGIFDEPDGNRQWAGSRSTSAATRRRSTRSCCGASTQSSRSRPIERA
ncbi:MAG: ThiF family adenylyltransferase [Myxococcales bacterium]|nr:ThiF family adenylyltransferase [Myxococcales bacterium]